MFTLDGIRKFHGWTHASLDLVLDHLCTMPTNDYVTELSGFGFRTLREQAIHIFNCEGFWVHTLRGLRYADRTVQECPVVADVRRLQKEVSQSTHAYLSSLDRSTTQCRYGASFLRWGRRRPHSCARPSSCADACLSSQRPDRCHVPYVGSPCSRHRSQPVCLNNDRDVGSVRSDLSAFVAAWCNS